MNTYLSQIASRVENTGTIHPQRSNLMPANPALVHNPLERPETADQPGLPADTPFTPPPGHFVSTDVLKQPQPDTATPNQSYLRQHTERINTLIPPQSFQEMQSGRLTHSQNRPKQAEDFPADYNLSKTASHQPDRPSLDFREPIPQPSTAVPIRSLQPDKLRSGFDVRPPELDASELVAKKSVTDMPSLTPIPSDLDKPATQPTPVPTMLATPPIYAPQPSVKAHPSPGKLIIGRINVEVIQPAAPIVQTRPAGRMHTPSSSSPRPDHGETYKLHFGLGQL